MKSLKFTLTTSFNFIFIPVEMSIQESNKILHDAEIVHHLHLTPCTMMLPQDQGGEATARAGAHAAPDEL